MKRILFCLFSFTSCFIILFFPLNARATAQIADVLIWNGDTLKLFSNPLELRADRDSLRVQIFNEKTRKYSEEDIFSFSTACNRGYRAEWIIVNDSLFLNNIHDCFNGNITINLSNIFSNIGENQKLFASWVNGDLYVPQGELILHVNLGYKSIFERETVLSIENGLLKNYELFHNRILKTSNFLEINEFTHRNINWDIFPDLTDRIIQVFIGVQPNEQGQFESIIEEYTYLVDFSMNDGDFFVTDTSNIFIQESIRIAKLIPEWDVIYQRGEIVGMSFMIMFSERNRKKYGID